MRKTRVGIFETNSSSTHSLAVQAVAEGEFTLDVFPIDSNGVIRIYPGQFDADVGRWNDPQTKVSFLLTYAYARENNLLLIQLYNVIKSTTNAKKILFCELDSEYSSKGSIPRSNWEDAESLFESTETLKNFILNPGNSIVGWESDNH